MALQTTAKSVWNNQLYRWYRPEKEKKITCSSKRTMDTCLWITAATSAVQSTFVWREGLKDCKSTRSTALASTPHCHWENNINYWHAEFQAKNFKILTPRKKIYIYHWFIWFKTLKRWLLDMIQACSTGKTWTKQEKYYLLSSNILWNVTRLA